MTKHTIELTTEEIRLLILATHKAEAIEKRIDTKNSRAKANDFADLRKKLNDFDKRF